MTTGSCDAAGPFRILARQAGGPRLADTTATRPVRVRHVTVGGDAPVVIAGPCAVETRAQTLEVAHAVREAGGDMLRGGAFKPRTSPYDFQGLGERGLEILAEAREATGLPIVTEVLDVRDVDLVARYADVLQLGARNMQHFPLLQEAGRTGLPVLLKRHWGATLTEWLSAAEYVAVEGNLDIILCERGIRTFTQGTYNRGTLDLNVVPAVKRLTWLPVLVDPSHATGDADLVPSAGRAGCSAGADGLLVEVIGERVDPNDALCDGHQSIRPSVLAELIRTVRRDAGLDDEGRERPAMRVGS
jgi:3-deoxy-7-phosphoheptulonate synthase